MDSKGSSYYTCSQNCLKPFGLWKSNKSDGSKLFFKIANLLIVFSVIVPLTLKAFELRHDLNYFLISISSLVFFCAYISKFITMIVNIDQIMYNWNSMQKDFSTFQGENLQILHKYQEHAKIFNAFYAVYMYNELVVFNGTVFIPHLMDLIKPLNEPRPRNPARLVRYNIPMMDNSNLFSLIHGTIGDVLAMTIIIGFDTLLIHFCQHGCALFKIVVRELGDISKIPKYEDNNNLTLKQHQTMLYRRFVRTVVIHKHALQFVEHLDAAYSTAIFVGLGLAVLTATVTEFQATVQKDIDLMVRFAIYATGQMLNMMYQNWPGQRIKDHSLQVHSLCYECEWYREDISDQSRKLLIFMMLRSKKPSCFTAGKMFVLDLETYMKIFKTSLSYLAFLTSMQ